MPAVVEKEAPIIKRYALWASRYDRHWAKYSDRTLSESLRLVERFADRPLSLLDVACGTGSFAERLRRRWPELHITGVDLSPDMLAVAKKRFEHDRRKKWLRASAELLPLPDESFDIVTCNNAFHLIPDQDTALAEFRRVLRPRGLLVIIDWDRDAPSIKFINLNYAVFGKHPRKIMAVDDLAAKVKHGGFEILHQKPFAATWFWRVGAVVGRKTQLTPPPARSQP